MISIAVFCDDRAMFDRAVRYYMDGSGDGTLMHYIINDAGQLQESGRDQAHAQLGIGLLSLVAEVGYHQGIDLYGAYDNRLLKGFEYTAGYNLGEQVPFEATVDRTGKYVHQRISPRGNLGMPIYEMVYNHYVNRMGVEAPLTARAAAQRRPGGAFHRPGGRRHPAVLACAIQGFEPGAGRAADDSRAGHRQGILQGDDAAVGRLAERHGLHP